MTHATPVELHDHVYGFRSSAHVHTCPSCRHSADLLAAERSNLKVVLTPVPEEMPMELLVRLREPPAHRRQFTPALAAAALLLGALSWTLFQPKAPVDSPPPPSSTSTQEEDLNKIIERLKSASPLKQEIARLALRKYGGIAVAPLEQAHADPALIEECRGWTTEDQALYRKLQSTKLTVEWKETPLLDALAQVRETSGISLHVMKVDNPSDIKITMALQNATILEILDRIKAATTLPWGRTRGMAPPKSPFAVPPSYIPLIMVGVESPSPPSSAPIRVRSVRGWAARQMPDPSDGEKTSLLLHPLVLAADPSLRDFLDSPQPEVRKLAEESLRRLDGPPSPSPRSALEDRLETSRMDADFESVPHSKILLEVGTDANLVLDPRVEIPAAQTTFKVRDLPLRDVLALLLSQMSLTYSGEADWTLITRPEWKPFRQQGSSLWASPEEARKAEEIIDGLASEDAGRREKAALQAKESRRAGLAWLAQASQVVEQTRVRPFSDAIGAILSELQIHAADLPGGADPADPDGGSEGDPQPEACSEEQ